MRTLVLLACVAACGPGSPGGPASGHMNAEPQEPAGPDGRSTEILARDARTNHAVVKHILVEADQVDLALKLVARLRAGEAIEPLMAEFSKDQGSAKSGGSYDVTPAAELVFEFKRLGLRLDVGESAIEDPVRLARDEADRVSYHRSG